MKFPIPEGYQAPEGVKEGDTFKEIATFSFEGGEMCIETIGQDETPIVKDKPKTKPKGMKAKVDEELAKGDTEKEM